MKDTRNPSMDIIRTLASFFVISVHFLLNSGFYDETVYGSDMYIMILMRTLFMVCVPLFLILSGYLSVNKEPDLSYYKKGLRIIFVYVITSVLCALYINVFKGEKLNLSGVIGGVLGYRLAPYSWYIEMYTGLFLLIPFLNIMYNNIKTQKTKQSLILIFIVLTSFPSVMNVYCFTDFSWVKKAATLTEYTQLIPQWWVILYPFTYYFIGCYLREFGLKINKYINLMLIVMLLVISSLYCWWRSVGNVFVAGAWGNWESLFNLVLTVLIFSYLMNMNFSKMPVRISKLFKFLSSVSLGSFLISWIFDDFFYSILNSKIAIMQDRLPYYFIIVPLIYTCSVIISYIINSMYDIIEKLIINSKR